jgi:mono/diheme cytochrome c family protein
MPVEAMVSGEEDSSTTVPTIPKMQAAATDEGIVRSIVKAPVTPDGTTAGRTTDFVINLEIPLQPNLPGLTLLEGKQIRVTLPEEIVFDNEADYPVKGVGEENCAPGNLQCSTGVLLQGWPQNPIRPPGKKYALSYEAETNTIVYTALADLVPAPPSEPGIKQIHLILNGFTNPTEPGSYPVEVTAEVGPDGAEEQGVGILEVLAEPRPSLNVTSVFNGEASYRPNTIHQVANPGELSAHPYDFLLWDGDGEALEGVTIEAVNARHSLLVQGEEVVGHVYVDAPAQAEGHQVASLAGSAIIKAPVTGFETGRLTVCFKAGTVPGDYVVTLKVDGGNTVTMVVEVIEVDTEVVEAADPAACQAALSGTEQDSMGIAAESVTGDPERGREIFETGGGVISAYCVKCHSLDGSVGTGAAGPSIQGISGLAGERMPELSAEDYLRQSITEPGSYVVEGFDNRMPRIFRFILSEEDLDDLVAFMLTQ